MLEEMGPTTFDEWKAYSQLEPFGPLEDALRFGYLVAITLNVNRGKRGKIWKPEEVFPQLKGGLGKKKQRDQTPEEMRVIAELWVAAMGGKFVEAGADPEASGDS